MRRHPFGSHAGVCYLRKPSVVGIGDDIEQLLDTTAPDRCNDPELDQVRANGIDGGRLLANEQMASAMRRQTALLFRGLGDLAEVAFIQPTDLVAEFLVAEEGFEPPTHGL